MLKQKKVFIGNKVLTLQKEQPDAERVDGLTFDATENTDLEFFVHEFINGVEAEAIIYGAKPKKILFYLQHSFPLIEAAGGVVRNENGDYLFIFRLGKWDLPKGKAEKGESASINALREVEEETGLRKILLREKLKSSYHMYPIKDKYVLKKTQWYRMLVNGNPALVPQTEESIERAEWISPSKIKDVLVNTYASLQDVIKQGIANE